MGCRIYDITLQIDESLAGWPGDAPYRREWTARIATGGSTNLSSISMSVHTGTHADAPLHYSDSGLGIDNIHPSVFIGPAILIDVGGRDSITRDELKTQGPPVPRVLLRARAWTDRTRFPESVPALTEDAVDYLAGSGVLLVGVDVPSVDALDSKDLPIHKRLGAAGITILESLDLSEPPAGEYTLVALPIKLVGSDGAPVRAVLIENCSDSDSV